MTKRTLATLVGTAVLIAAGIAVFAFTSRENPAPETQPTAEQDAGVTPSTNETSAAREQIPPTAERCDRLVA